MATVMMATVASAQEEALKLSGYLQTDERFLTDAPHEWAWNENRLSLELDKKISGNASFRSEVWFRNLGVPRAISSAGLYEKGAVDPINIDLREANVRLTGFLTRNLDLTIGRQRIAWGTADRFNPTDNVNPYDLEDLLDFGRHRGSDAVALHYYFNNSFSLQGVYVPLFQPWNMPVGLLGQALQPDLTLPEGISLAGYSDMINNPEYNLRSGTAGARLKGFAGQVDFSLSYLYGYEGMPFTLYNTITPGGEPGSVQVHSELGYLKRQVIGADFATSIRGAGLWGEAALFIPDDSLVMYTDMTALFPGAPAPVIGDSLLLKKEPYLEWIVGTDYSFANNSYLNVQYLHGFIHESGRENLNDYLILRYEISFLNNKLTFSPLSGGAAVSNWDDPGNNYAWFYVPSVSYMATDNLKLELSTALFDGKGSSLFSRLSDYNMIMFRMKYDF
ncbi:MAG: hypothetical protein Kow00127_24740 [Bacteroidales bacterium]